MSHLLIVDDDVEVLDLLQKFLRQHGYEVDVASDGQGLWQALERRVPDLVILDVMLPGDSGLVLCQRLQAEYKVAVIMLTAMGELSDRVVGLELGADDYLTKPFAARELLARVRAVLRRAGESPGSPLPASSRAVLEFSGWQLDVLRRELRSPEGVMIPLSNGEFELLLVFAEHPRRVLSRQQLLDLARGEAHEAYDRSIDVQVSRLRRKLESDGDSEPLIRTLRNVGYLFTASVTKR
ncbi:MULTISPECIES: response regulator transcription factor [unclassified Pseudomonas]|uniref:response regulator n=1 Tax=unclassified Pseudomonas TaxID=196821 RepID=UPI0003FE893A|nr:MULTISPECIES: response regulator transcription factor [unclassified Pseudomonas]GLO56448.1 DNA-binding response regulator [Pseudomonas putida]MDE4538585.1 response regulator transcription factor [Pseudomonas sp. ITEM 17296]SMF30498.1 two-component system, OmpR family, response regulator [Pseudomonas sp. LAIL14HWK12:I11]SMR78180.1 two-component system, OmpR family, response regulator [Pseudomonas sp. LAIL14HWK12:I10]SOD04478.1 two-component system, OmpR family, response regulator [Pseudomona